jgi:hypothetical protein
VREHGTLVKMYAHCYHALIIHPLTVSVLPRSPTHAPAHRTLLLQSHKAVALMTELICTGRQVVLIDSRDGEDPSGGSKGGSGGSGSQQRHAELVDLKRHLKIMANKYGVPCFSSVQEATLSICSDTSVKTSTPGKQAYIAAREQFAADETLLSTALAFEKGRLLSSPVHMHPPHLPHTSLTPPSDLPHTSLTHSLTPPSHTSLTPPSHSMRVPLILPFHHLTPLPPHALPHTYAQARLTARSASREQWTATRTK